MDPTSTACPVYTKTETRGRIDLCGVWKHQINTSAERPDESGAWATVRLSATAWICPHTIR